MANEVLNRVCDAEARHRPQAVVRSLGWGPWEAGMVTPALKARFEALGVPLISLTTGAQMLVDEVRHGPGSPTSVVLGGEPKPEALLNEGEPPTTQLDLLLSAQTHPWLADHTVAGAPVVPVALVVDRMVAAARALRPGRAAGSVTNLNVHKGIRLAAWPASTRFVLRVQEQGADVLSMVLTTENGQPLYRANVALDAAPAGGPVPSVTAPAHAGEVYDGTLLFHGPALQVLGKDVCVDATGATASVSPRPLAGSGGGVDVGAFDGALQLALLWAKAATGGPSLPMGIDEIVLHKNALDDTSALVLTRRTAKGAAGSADISLVDSSGAAMATLRGVRTIRRPDVPST
jgi:hypothetical protein